MPLSHADASLVGAARDLQPLIEREADQIERDCTMIKPVVDAIEGAGLFQLGTPVDLGELEANVATLAGVCEALAFADGAVGWAFAQNIITTALLSYLDPETAKTFALLGPGAGHFAPLGVAGRAPRRRRLAAQTSREDVAGRVANKDELVAYFDRNASPCLRRMLNSSAVETFADCWPS